MNLDRKLLSGKMYGYLVAVLLLISLGKFLEACFVEKINYCCDTSQLAAE